VSEEDAGLVSDLCEVDEGLSTWELDFVESLAEQRDAGRPMSDRQRAKATEILERLNR
jgi:hypothetical protein